MQCTNIGGYTGNLHQKRKDGGALWTGLPPEQKSMMDSCMQLGKKEMGTEALT